ncbi:hypothetical protein AAG570_002951 [Ranatra chinensis]|uniref:Uncharacterized protein n=1 Tax=Ranatra chinensis TaxID=642074 RepID=A0ABD0YTV3_9HEMI
MNSRRNHHLGVGSGLPETLQVSFDEMTTLDPLNPTYERIRMVQTQLRKAIQNHHRDLLAQLKKEFDCTTFDAKSISSCNKSLAKFLIWPDTPKHIPVYKPSQNTNSLPPGRGCETKKIATWKPRKDSVNNDNQNGITVVNRKLEIDKKIILDNSNKVKIVLNKNEESTLLLRSKRMQSVLKSRRTNEASKLTDLCSPQSSDNESNRSLKHFHKKASPTSSLESLESDDVECAEIIPLKTPLKSTSQTTARNGHVRLEAKLIAKNNKLQSCLPNSYAKRYLRNDSEFNKDKKGRFEGTVSPTKIEPCSPMEFIGVNWGLGSIPGGSIVHVIAEDGDKPKLVLTNKLGTRDDRPRPPLSSNSEELPPNWISMGDTGQDIFLGYLGLVSKAQFDVLKRKRCERKRRSVAGQSSLYSDYFQPPTPKRTYGPRKAVATGTTTVTTPSTSQQVVVEVAAELEDEDEKPIKTEQNCSICHTNVGTLESCHSCSDSYHAKCLALQPPSDGCPTCRAPPASIKNIVGANSASSASSTELIKRYLTASSDNSKKCGTVDDANTSDLMPVIKEEGEEDGGGTM